MIWQALCLEVLLAAVEATSRNLKNSSKNSSISNALIFFSDRKVAKAATNLIILSAEAVRRLKSNRGAKVSENAVKNFSGDADERNRVKSSLSFRVCVAWEVLVPSKTLAIFSLSNLWWCNSSSSVARDILDKMNIYSPDPLSVWFLRGQVWSEEIWSVSF